MIVFLIALVVLLINVPFGYWRKSERKMSMNWFIAIHVPVLISIGLKYLAGVEFRWYYFLFFLGIFLIGQYIGQILYIKSANKKRTNV